jgi:2-phospho-L-lactate guanylyltransferase
MTFTVVLQKQPTRAKTRLSIGEQATIQLISEVLSRILAYLPHDSYVIMTDSKDGLMDLTNLIPAKLLVQPVNDLNQSLTLIKNRARNIGYDRLVVVPADIPFLNGFDFLANAPDGAGVIVPDQRLQGTNLLAVPTTTDFAFNFGPGSFGLHLEQLRDLPGSLVHPNRYFIDIDTRSDIELANLLFHDDPLLQVLRAKNAGNEHGDHDLGSNARR